MKARNNSTLNDELIKNEQSDNQGEKIIKTGKRIYKAEKPNHLIQEFKSDELLKIVDEQKASELDELRNSISSYLFEYLEGFHIPTHYVKKYSETKMLVKKTEILPITIRVFNTISDEILKRFGMTKVVSTEYPIIEHHFNNSQNGKSWINEYHIYAFSIATPEEYKQMNRIASKTNAVLRSLCERRQLILADLQLEFGRCNDKIVIIDELSPITCHFLDNNTEFKSKQDRFKINQENAIEAIAELNNRLLLKV